MKNYYIIDENNKLVDEIKILEIDDVAEDKKQNFIEEKIEDKLQEGQRYTLIPPPENYDSRYNYFENDEWKEDFEKHLSDLKKFAFNQLWHNYKMKQNKFIDAEDLILATNLANAGNPKGIAVRDWVINLWKRYYEVKDAIQNSSSIEEFLQINLNEKFEDCPYTVRELNQELFK